MDDDNCGRTTNRVKIEIAKLLKRMQLIRKLIDASILNRGAKGKNNIHKTT